MMTELDYRTLQDRFNTKLKNHRGYSTNRETAYNDGVLACKSILKEVFEWQRRHEPGEAVESYGERSGKVDRSRWKGCDMCTAEYTKKDWNTTDVGSHEFRVVGSSLMYCDQVFGWEGIGIHFCPKCGRPLTKKAWAELEQRIGGNT